MKNFIRLVLLITLVVCASKVLFSDFEIVKSENETAAIVNK
jgi:cell division protein FtsL